MNNFGKIELHSIKMSSTYVHNSMQKFYHLVHIVLHVHVYIYYIVLKQLKNHLKKNNFYKQLQSISKSEIFVL